MKPEPTTDAKAQSADEATEEQPKRGRGRPRKAADLPAVNAPDTDPEDEPSPPKVAKKGAKGKKK